MRFGIRLLIFLPPVFFLVACSYDDYKVKHEPNYDYLIGQIFSDSIYKGRDVYKKIRETGTHEELESRLADDCILVFGVRKKDEVIEYWRVDSEPGTCRVRKKPLNR